MGLFILLSSCFSLFCLLFQLGCSLSDLTSSSEDWWLICLKYLDKYRTECSLSCVAPYCLPNREWKPFRVVEYWIIGMIVNGFWKAVSNTSALNALCYVFVIDHLKSELYSQAAYSTPTVLWFHIIIIIYSIQRLFFPHCFIFFIARHAVTYRFPICCVLCMCHCKQSSMKFKWDTVKWKR